MLLSVPWRDATALLRLLPLEELRPAASML
jgi:hypothetical protein